ncbi:N-formylglutamate amidohydrolase [Pseudomonas sp. PDM27]|uniref:N-formylglutamate amidohydrolase n=1 Tax=Pseudomonas sp. PDM27 TaxID=2854769 RepID=UPI001C45D5BB|nr:N-formylglutamate amidohydrolase [Pseudomonas sp. PDM27]MBV7565823.1 N-formylglutamate amidohydrolase [Pseudomonas sp. PDM27]
MHDSTETLEYGLYDKPVYTVSRENAEHAVILVCEHASAFIPPELDGLGLTDEAARQHIAWDIGALALAESLSEALGATLISANYSRLLIDLNRPLEALDSIPVRSEIYDVLGNQRLDGATRQYRQERLFKPFHQKLSELIDARLAMGREVRVIGVHSFTPVYHGQPRAVEVGILFDRAHTYAHTLIQGLAAHDLKVAANEPYEINPLEDMTVPFHGDQRGINAALIEVRNDLLQKPEAVRSWSDYLAPLL